MTRSVDTIFNDIDIFAKNGDKLAPTFQMNTGWPSSFDAGGGEFPSRVNYNYLYYRLYALCELVTKYGSALEWDGSIAYVKGAIVVSTTGVPYFAKQPSTNIDPDTDTPSSFWGSLSQAITNASAVTYNNDPAVVSGTNIEQVMNKITTGIASQGHDIIVDKGGVKANVTPLLKNTASPIEYLTAGALTYNVNSRHPKFPTTLFSDANIYNETTHSFVENGVLGQTTEWIINMRLVKDKKADELTVFLVFANRNSVIYNKTQSVCIIPTDNKTVDFAVRFTTISNQVDLEYGLTASCDKEDNSELTIVDIQRVSHATLIA